ncbi:MAG: RNA pyrophosphohydrolase [Rhizobiales bacterium]|nr:RNA pyrophosphohydrolase [Hyphomicrobiales bacterium]
MNKNGIAAPDGYRPCVGCLVVSTVGFVWIGRRIPKPHDEHEPSALWQMPQGGIDEGEDTHAAARRELAEETGIRSVEIAAESAGWLHYDLPPHLLGKALQGRYRGQKQKWIAMRFVGNESEIDLAPPGHAPEFDAWRWAHPDELLEIIVPFKREVYARVLEEFRHLLAR